MRLLTAKKNGMSSFIRLLANRGFKAQRRRLQSTFCSQVSDNYKTGQKLSGFTIEKVSPVTELSLVALKLKHDATGAQHLHLARDDSDNLFGVGFRTTPMDSTGVAHILEHTTLCGSIRYPCCDPFFKMLTRSMATFMNAFTGSDFTLYPFSTQNKQDFENLLSVYLDSTFFPKLEELDFKQEGWRLEHEDPNDPSSPIIFKGVVFNEMKGAWTNPEQLFAQSLQSKLLPSHTYSHNSGGDPINIPDLTLRDLRQFHATHYHPSNTRFFSYGDLPVENHLGQVHETINKFILAIDPQTEVPAEPRWNTPRSDHISCGVDQMAANPEKQTTVCVSFLLGKITDTFENFTNMVLSSLLVDGPTSPFYRALLEPNIGSDFAPTTGYDNSVHEGSFSVGLQGIHSDGRDKVLKIIDQTIDSVIESGFEQERIEAVLHKIELSVKNEKTHFGLRLLMSVNPAWNHDGDPTEDLQINQNMERLKQILTSDPSYLQGKVRQHLRDNTHRLTLSMSPKETFEAERQSEEKEKLDALVASLTAEDKEKIYQSGLKLAEHQSKPDDASCLPTLQISDIDRQTKVYKTSQATLENVQVQISKQPTNEICYFRAASNIDGLPDELFPYLPLFCSVITKMGAGDMDYLQLAQREELKTGGLSAQTHVYQLPNSLSDISRAVLFSSFCLPNNIEDMFSLWTDIFSRPNLSDLNRLTTLVRMEASALAMSIVDSGHAYAMTRSASTVTPLAAMKENLAGLTQVSLMKSVAEMSDLSEVVEKLRTIANTLMAKDRLRCSINTTESITMNSLFQLGNFLKSIPSSAASPSSSTTFQVDDGFSSQKTHVVFPFPVNYAGQSFRTVPYTHQHSASLGVLAKLMTTKFLHKEIREKGGAYGGGATNRDPGVFSYFSYRDPNNEDTFKAFSHSFNWLQEGNFGQSEIDESKLSFFQELDKPIAPSDRGMTEFLFGITDEMRQERREAVFNVSKADLQEVTSKYLDPAQYSSGQTLIGPEAPFTSNDDTWKILKE